MLWLVFVVILPQIWADSIKCADQSKWTNTPLPKNLYIPSDYAAVVSFTHDQTNETLRISEQDFNDVFVYETSKKGAFNGKILVKQGDVVVYNGNTCTKKGNASLSEIYPFSKPFRDIFGANFVNLKEIVQKVVDAKYDGSFDSGVVKVNGFPTVKWTGCINQTDKHDGFEVRINFVGENTNLPPFSANTSWPQILNIELINYNVPKPNATAVIKDSITISILVLQKVNPVKKQQASQLTRGIFCDSFNATKLPNALPEKFEADIEYIDAQDKVIDTVELMYDGVNKIISFALDFNRDSDIPYVQTNEKDKKALGRAKIFLDFKTGFQYQLSKDGRVCKQVRAIQNTWQAVKTEADGRLSLRDPTESLFTLEGNSVYAFGEVIEEGVIYDAYVAKKVKNDTKEETIIEVLYHKQGWSVEAENDVTVHSIVQYHKKSDGTLINKSILNFNQLRNNTIIGTSWSKHTIFPCLSDGKSDNFFFLKLANGTFKQLQQLGFENVESALAEAVAKTANISVLRISQFLLKQLQSQLMACFLLGERNEIPYANTTDIVIEKNVTEVRNVLNGTLQTQQINVNIVSDDLKTQTIAVNGLGVVSTEDDHHFPPIMPGYSGGSMFILGIFSFMLGAAITVASYIFYTKRQGMRGIVYQVFE